MPNDRYTHTNKTFFVLLLFFQQGALLNPMARLATFVAHIMGGRWFVGFAITAFCCCAPPMKREKEYQRNNKKKRRESKEEERTLRKKLSHWQTGPISDPSLSHHPERKTRRMSKEQSMRGR
jgi:hypothetical protein